MDTEELLPGELAARAGVAVSALHFYERQALITSRRTSGNQRRYSRDTLRRVAFIRMSHRLGIPLARVRDALRREVAATLEDFDTEFFGDTRPATTTVQVVRLATDPRCLVEVNAVAVID